ncbi:heme-binding protein [Vibrio parahaemolyticus]|nr:heme-binding protein [Vibrio parahaemolyticus]
MRLSGSGLVGVVTVSGLPQLDDHQLVVEILKTMTETKPS